MGEGARRAGEALCLSTNAVEILARFAKEPSSGLRPPSPMLRTGEGKTLVSSESRLSKICLHPCSCGPSWILRKFSPDSPALKRGEGDFDHAASSAWPKA